jgi:hypothetical protein
MRATSVTCSPEALRSVEKGLQITQYNQLAGVYRKRVPAPFAIIFNHPDKRTNIPDEVTTRFGEAQQDVG